METSDSSFQCKKECINIKSDKISYNLSMMAYCDGRDVTDVTFLQSTKLPHKINEIMAQYTI